MYMLTSTQQQRTSAFYLFTRVSFLVADAHQPHTRSIFQRHACATTRCNFKSNTVNADITHKSYIQIPSNLYISAQHNLRT